MSWLRPHGELLLGLRYFRNDSFRLPRMQFGKLLLDLRTSETCRRSCVSPTRVSYYLIYGISETR